MTCSTLFQVHNVSLLKVRLFLGTRSLGPAGAPQLPEVRRPICRAKSLRSEPNQDEPQRRQTAAYHADVYFNDGPIRRRPLVPRRIIRLGKVNQRLQPQRGHDRDAGNQSAGKNSNL